MFFGEFFSKTDKDGRSYIPEKLRKKKLKDIIFLTKGPDGCLLICQKTKDSIERKMNKQGMILIPKSLRVYAGLEEKIVFVGCGKRIEIWSVKNWVREKKKMDKRWFRSFFWGNYY